MTNLAILWLFRLPWCVYRGVFTRSPFAPYARIPHVSNEPFNQTLGFCPKNLGSGRVWTTHAYKSIGMLDDKCPRRVVNKSTFASVRPTPSADRQWAADLPGFESRR